MDIRPNEPKQLTEHDIAEQKHVLEDKTFNKTKKKCLRTVLRNVAIVGPNC